MVSRDPFITYKDGHAFDMTRNEIREKTMVQYRRFIEVSRTIKDPVLKYEYYEAICSLSESFAMKTYVHDMLYRTSINLFGTEEQKTKFMPDIDSYKVLGCFAMTELGHSSSLQDLETTATFDKENDEWIIHSPTLTSTKWWIGMAGQTATHTVMVAQTIVLGESQGLNWFILPLRDTATGRLLPGITCGDVGAKAGRNGLDNGFIQATNVRIPRGNMLMKWTQVDADGNVAPPPHPAIIYATLIPERLTALSALRILLGQAVTVACRYTITRRQGPVNQQIIDYQSQYVNLLPMVAGVYVYHFVELKMLARWDRLQGLSISSPMEYVAQLPDIHSISAGLKAVSMWWGADSLELCRRACGGHGYSAYNAIAGHIGDWGVLTTGGGDNYPMAQQLSRYVLSCVERSLKGKKNDGESAQFLNCAEAIASRGSCRARTEEEFNDIAVYLNLFAFLTVKLAFRLAANLKISGEENKEEAWNANMVDLIKLSSLYCHHHIISLFLERIEELKINETIPPPPPPSATAPSPQQQYHHQSHLIPILLRCGILFAADCARREAVELALEEGYLSAEQVRTLRSFVFNKARELRMNVVGLTDAWGFPDFILKAPIARADGDIYNAYFDTVMRAPDCFETPYYVREIQPILRQSSKL